MESLKQIRRFKYFSAIGGSTSGGMGIDQHKRYSHITVIDEVGDLVEERKLYHQDKEGMLNYFKSFNSQETKVVLEATGNWYWLADLLESANLIHILAHPYFTKNKISCKETNSRNSKKKLG